MLVQELFLLGFQTERNIYLGVITSKILLYYKNRFNVKKKKLFLTLYYFSYQEFVYFDIKYKGVLCYTSYIFNKLKKKTKRVILSAR